jgi:hypothetical protein
MTDATGYAFLDGIDLWTQFRIFIESGSAALLQYAPKKESIVRDWGDANGVQVDLSRIFLGARDIVLNCAIVVQSEAEFWEKHNFLISQFAQPNLHRLSFKAHGERSYYVYYKECNNYKAEKALTGNGLTGLKAYRFSLVISEPEPEFDASHVFLVTEDNVFLIT